MKIDCPRKDFYFQPRVTACVINDALSIWQFIFRVRIQSRRYSSPFFLFFLQMRRNRKSASSRQRIDDWLWRASARGGISLVSSCCSLPPKPSRHATAWPSSFSALPHSAQRYRATRRRGPRAVTWARFPSKHGDTRSGETSRTLPE